VITNEFSCKEQLCKVYKTRKFVRVLLETEPKKVYNDITTEAERKEKRGEEC
jgi:hypothetical protein